MYTACHSRPLAQCCGDVNSAGHLLGKRSPWGRPPTRRGSNSRINGIEGRMAQIITSQSCEESSLWVHDAVIRPP